jgi:hypothetical protein
VLPGIDRFAKTRYQRLIVLRFMSVRKAVLSARMSRQKC